MGFLAKSVGTEAERMGLDRMDPDVATAAQDERQQLAEDGLALPDGSWPIRDEDELAKAIDAVPKIEDEDLRGELTEFVKDRAEDLEVELPSDWE